MLIEEIPTTGLSGSYSDVLYDKDGQVMWESGFRKNLILVNCRTLLSAFMHSQAGTVGLLGIQLGTGNPAWDTPPGISAPLPTDMALVDAYPYVFLAASPPAASSFALSYLDPALGTVSTVPTNRLQILVTLGPNVPPWPDTHHVAGNLREFGLVAQLSGTPVLVNSVRHPVIAKDPATTLVRTIQLVF